MARSTETAKWAHHWRLRAEGYRAAANASRSAAARAAFHERAARYQQLAEEAGVIYPATPVPRAAAADPH